MAIQNISKSNDEPTREQEIVNGDLLKKIKLIEKAFK
jgi:F420-dependent methylenetetrahydromethanopterin dehydrogenase